MARNKLKNLIAGHRVVVTTADDQSWRGVVHAVANDCVVLIAAEHLAEGRDPIKAEGAIIVERPNVSSYQLLAGVS